MDQRFASWFCSKANLHSNIGWDFIIQWLTTRIAARKKRKTDEDGETEVDPKTESSINNGEIRNDFKFNKMFKASKVKREA